MTKLEYALFSMLMLLIPVAGLAEAPEFETDEKLASNARKWATEFVSFAEQQYGEELNWSQVSIKFLDDIGNDLHRIYTEENPSEEEIAPVARALGSYIAEVYRIFYGGEWGWVNIDSGSYPGIRTKNGATFLPLKKSLDRIKTGEEPDLWEYFQVLTSN